MATSETSLFTVILTSSAIATVLTTFGKLGFDAYVAPRLSRSRSANAVVDRLRPQLIKSAQSADAYVSLMLRFCTRGWFTEDDPYFRHSLLYSVGEFFTWYHIVERYAHPEFEASGTSAGDFWRYGFRAMKALTGFGYQRDFSSDEKRTHDGEEVPRKAIQAIGELMTIRHDEAGLPEPMGFVAFTNKIDEDPDFRKWFAYLDRAFREVEKSRRDTLFFQRMAIFSVNLKVFAQKLHPRGAKGGDQPVRMYQFSGIDKRVTDQVLQELKKDRVRFELPEDLGGPTPEEALGDVPKT